MRTRTGARAVSGRRGRSGERGFTLIELIVTMAITTVIAGALGGTFAVASKVLRPGGVQDRLASASDDMVFEQVVSRDVSRASCVKVFGAAAGLGSCSQGFITNAAANAACTSTSATTSPRLCLAWPQLSDSACHIVAYTQPVAGGQVRRTEYYGSTVRATGISGDSFQRLDFTANAAGGTWLTSLTVTLTSALNGTGVLVNPATVRLDLGVLVASPSGPGATTALLGAAQC